MRYDEGGAGQPILLLHGLMGSAATWRRHVPWLREHGHVFTYDAPGHRRPPPTEPARRPPPTEPARRPPPTEPARRPPPTELTTEAFVEDLLVQLDELGPAVVIGHSMGALHGWCAASTKPDLVTALVVEDIAPDFRGRTADGWAAMIRAWPQPFPDADAVRAYFGDVAGEYFLDSFVRTDDGWRLHGDVDTFEAISQEWGTRDFWTQWDAVSAPTLLIEAEHTITPPGQMSEMHRRNGNSTYFHVAGAGHLVHDEKPAEYRAAVEGFLRGLA